MLGVDPNMIVGDKQVAMIRQARNQAQAAQAQAAAMQQNSQTVKNMAQAPTGEANALTDVTNMFSGYSSPSPLEV
jgi:predicted 2-oxoglutarate/Fe(II)-dependent dioxygenase YbiX